MYDIAFLHTGEVHIQTFQFLIDELSPQLKIKHLVDEPLLDHAREFGQDAILEQRVEQRVRQLAEHAKLVICTCSSIGEFAENCRDKFALNVQRIDRAMANQAVLADNILVLAALESTLSPTKTLIAQSAINLKQTLNCDYLVVEGAWPYFTSENYNAYYQAIADVIIKKQESYDLIVLAQASMAGATTLSGINIPVLASPKLGVKSAIEFLTN